MNRQITFQQRGWGDYLYWQIQDKKTLRRINQLLQDAVRNEYNDIGSSDPFKGDKLGWQNQR
ncbi:type II toxin-antitoxin system YoeB family toxin [Synergistaceae bacterium OttesenSCG-928-I11]|nr:type II toxin-antitoxin system YoeB family toxin [Synergistaceae bacterium OttesenSCG-928-I11]